MPFGVRRYPSFHGMYRLGEGTQKYTAILTIFLATVLSLKLHHAPGVTAHIHVHYCASLAAEAKQIFEYWKVELFFFIVCHA